MVEPSAPPSADELFQQWKQFLDAGTLSTATDIAAGRPDLVGPLQKQINDYLEARAAEVQETLSAAADYPAEVEADPEVPGLTVLDRLGRGGMGVVYRVRDQLDREFALKLVRRGQLSERGRARFMEEARAMARLDHPHVARVHHYDEYGGRPYFLMPIYPANLAERMAEYQADPVKAVRLMAAVAEGMGHLHSRGFVHRDLKPANILLTATGEPAVSDFGLVKALGADDSESASGSGGSGSAETKPTGARRSRTVVGAVLGTWRYMAPEQAAGLTELAGPKWDVWALGVILHELVTGQSPASSRAPQRLLDPAAPDNPPPSAVKPELNPKLERVIQKCLARDEKERYADGLAVAADLRRWLAPHRRRRAVLWLVAGLLLLATIGLAAVAPWRPAGPITTDPGPTGQTPPTPDEVLVDIQARLRRGESVELFGPSGLPLWSELAVGSGVVQPHVSDVDGALTLDSSQLVLMDLPPTGLERYRLQVQVRQVSDLPAPRFGVYAGRHRLPTKGGESDCVAALWFNDRAGKDADGAARGSGRVALRTYVRLPGAGGVLSGVELPGNDIPPPPRENGRAGYHSLAIDVTPTRITAWLDDRPMGTIDWPLPADLELDFAEVARLNPGTRSDFNPAGGYGLLAYGGSASFRRATVRALPPP